MVKKQIIFMVLLLYVVLAHSQNGPTSVILESAQYNRLTWQHFVEKVENNTSARIFYYPDSIVNFKVIFHSDSSLLIDVLQDNLTPLKLNVYKDKYNNFFVFRNLKLKTGISSGIFPSASQTLSILSEPGNPEEKPETNDGNVYLETSEKYVAQEIIIGDREPESGKSTAIIRGAIYGLKDKEPIPQATLAIKKLELYSTANDSGNYRLELPTGKHTLEVMSIGRYDKILKLIVHSDGVLNIPLTSQAFLLEETVISSNKHQNVRGSQMGLEKIDPKTLKQFPVVLGEQDILKMAKMMPGVQSIGEVSAGLNVRGAPSDQNMFYINEIPVYNTSHLYGFFSAFNGDAINDFSLYKNNIPIKYGGNLSSVFEVQAKKGNTSNITAKGGLSPVTGRVMIEGPIKKNASSYLIGVRSTYSDWILKKIDNIEINNSRAAFSDIISNINLNITKKDNLSLFVYGSQDNSNLAFGTETFYSNLGSSLKWRHNYNDKLRSQISIIYSEYFYNDKMKDNIYSAYKQSFNMKHLQSRVHFDYSINKNLSLVSGIDATHYTLSLGDYLPYNEQSLIEPIRFEPEQSILGNVYLGGHWEVNKKITLNGGLRYSLYNYLGPKTIYSYTIGQPREIENITDTTSYSKDDVIADYSGLDIRIGGVYIFNKDLSVKASYNKLHQYMFLLSNTVSISPTDKWKLADAHLEPMTGRQYSLGVYKNLLGGGFETSLEAYYKEVDNFVEYEDGAEFLKTPLPETEVIQGKMKAWGIEWMLKKTIGSLQGWLNYTYSTTSVMGVDNKTGESNNFGLKYPANYDKPHSVNLSLNYRVSKRFSISTNVVYSTGRPISYPTSVYYLNGAQITSFSKRNEYRLPNYFRTDVSFNIEGNLKKRKLAHGSWSVSFYNLTSRNNIYSVYFETDDGELKGYKLSIFGTVIPSISYNFKLGNYND